ncbi:MAG: nickel pincer cofactor biosynthesis protein LarB [Planctomycetes bacterium]|nr:nickel pincer cofactor biosynthesis protein LarB [Planctomycetota bacterium]
MENIDLRSNLKVVLDRVKSGELGDDEAIAQISKLVASDLGFATVDHGREARCGVPEVIFGEGKRVDDLLAIARDIHSRSGKLLVTRCDPDKLAALESAFPAGVANERARTFAVRKESARSGLVAIVCAGTSDVPVAEEAAVTAEFVGAYCERHYDVGVAGLHRLLLKIDAIRKARAIVVCAGMEGALASVVAGLVDVPVIGVPTSVGYGASFGGIAALLAMLSACAPGVSVVNIDNGFGAGIAAAKIAGAGVGD